MEKPPEATWFYSHPFNSGQHVAHNEMLDECVRRDYDWHIRVDDDCWIITRKWLGRLLRVADNVKASTGMWPVLSPQIEGLDAPPQTIGAHDIGIEIVEKVEMLGGIFRMSHMGLIRYFRWDERQAMGFGDASQFKSFCDSARSDLLRVRGIRATHGESTQRQNMNAAWKVQHDMDQYVPLGL
jgi:hypothetical protein